MTEPLDVLIQQVLVAKLVPNASVATSDITNPATPVALPLIAYTPTSGTKYLDIRAVMRAEPERPFIADDDGIIHKGVFQVDAVVPDNQGAFPGLRLAALVATRFPLGPLAMVDVFRLKILKPPAIAAPIKDGSWVRFPVSVYYWLCG